MKLSVVQNIWRIGLKWGGNRLSLIDRCQMLSPIQQSSMQQCTGVTFQISLVLLPVAPIKGLASMHFSILQPMLLLCGNTSAEQTTQHIPYLVLYSSLDSFWMRSLFHLRYSYRISSSLMASFVAIVVVHS